MFSTAPVRRLSSWCLRVSPKSTSAQQCPACACGQKTILRAPRWRSPRGTAPNRKVQTGSAAAGGHRNVATRKATGDLATRRGAGDPVRRAEWMTVLRYGHLRSAPVVVDACVRKEWEPPTLLAALSISTRQSWRLLDGFLPLRRCTNTSLRSDAVSVQEVHMECREIHFTSSSLPSRAVGVIAPPCTTSGCPKCRGS